MFFLQPLTPFGAQFSHQSFLQWKPDRPSVYSIHPIVTLMPRGNLKGDALKQ